jgi:hypothetical protein
MKVPHFCFDNEAISDFALLNNKTIKRKRKAIMYLNPANVRGGISCKPILIITQEVAHMNTTNRA